MFYVIENDQLEVNFRIQGIFRSPQYTKEMKSISSRFLYPLLGDVSFQSPNQLQY